MGWEAKICNLGFSLLGAQGQQRLGGDSKGQLGENDRVQVENPAIPRLPGFSVPGPSHGQVLPRPEPFLLGFPRSLSLRVKVSRPPDQSGQTTPMPPLPAGQRVPRKHADSLTPARGPASLPSAGSSIH